MPGPNGARGNIPLIRQSYKKTKELGETTRGDEYRMVFEGYPHMTFLVIATQMPPCKREQVEVPGPQGIKILQQGKYLHSGDITITFKEVIAGHTLSFIRDLVRDKVYFDATLSLTGESHPEGNPFTSCTIEDSWLECDAIDLSNEDSTMMVKPAGTIHFNWATWADDEQETKGLAEA